MVRHSKRFLVGVVVSLVCGGVVVWAQEQRPSPRQLAEQITREAEQAVKPLFEQETPKEERRDGLYLLLSFALPESTLQEYFGQARSANARVVFRGIAEASLPKMVKRVKRVMGVNENDPEKTDPRWAPAVILDPVIFRQVKASEIPVLVVRQGEQYIAVTGIGSLEDGLNHVVRHDRRFDKISAWYEKQRTSWHRGEAQPEPSPPLPELAHSVTLSAGGRTTQVVEPDLLEVIQARIKSVDWDRVSEKAKHKIETRFRQGPKIPLPVVTKDRVRYTDPTVAVPEDVIEPQSGLVMATAGTRINPLAHVQLNETYVILDATDPKQVEAMDSTVSGSTRHNLTVMVTAGDVFTLVRRWQRPVYWVNPTIIERFGVKAVPSIITQEGQRFRVEEVKVK
ncbi:MAG: hypothetical protein NPIRA04_05590 [Nitrospirales bacterium]|nr:MAG: hypothetical protein NPIRA04_05590 [Nitrospirales bacterium]